MLNFITRWKGISRTTISSLGLPDVSETAPSTHVKRVQKQTALYRGATDLALRAAMLTPPPDKEKVYEKERPSGHMCNKGITGRAQARLTLL